jgi:16S rRNA (cytosine1402-N4)-methyltransferase
MLEECIDGLQIKPDGVYVDATFGGGGHSKAILDKLNSRGVLLAFDQDSDALQNIPVDDRLIFCHANFKYLQNFCLYHGYEKVDGILADFGVSSHQIDQGERGFSFRFDDAIPDMRMNREQEIDAKTILNEYSDEQLAAIFKKYGEVKSAFVAAKTIVAYRRIKPIETISDIIAALGSFIKPKTRNKQLSQIFQALRIEVNNEMDALYAFLNQVTELLKPKGRLVVLTYHSLEDRPVKYIINTGNMEGKRHTNEFGVVQKSLQAINKKPIEASNKELEMNNRSRSAKLRIAEKV